MVEKRRLAFAVAGLVALAVAVLVVVLADGGGDDHRRDALSGASAASSSAGGSTAASVEPRSSERRRTEPPKPTLRSGKVTKIDVDEGDTVAFDVRVESDDELHVHGYDITRTLPAGKTVQVSFEADLEGVFEIELHETGEQVGELTVNP